MTRLLPVLLLAALAACGQKPAEPAAEPAPVATPAPAVETPAPTPVETPAVEPAPADEGAPAKGDATAADAPAADAPATGDDVAAAEPAPAEAPLPPVIDPATAPRPGIDYTVLATPQPTFGSGGIEIAEVFAYTCIHCANLQPNVSLWKKTLPSDVRFVYVPGAFGGVSDNLARGFFAAEVMGILEKSHEQMFNAFFVDHALGEGSVEDLATHYATYGVDRDTFLSTMNSFAVTSKVNRARQFALRTGVQSTPTFILNGKYSAHVTGDRGPQGLFDTLAFLAAHERAGTAP